MTTRKTFETRREERTQSRQRNLPSSLRSPVLCVSKSMLSRRRRRDVRDQRDIFAEGGLRGEDDHRHRLEFVGLLGRLAFRDLFAGGVENQLPRILLACRRELERDRLA